jgi:hypothetical protein
MFSFADIQNKITGFIKNVVNDVTKRTIDILFNAFWKGNYYIAIIERRLEENKSNWIIQKLLFKRQNLQEPPLDTWFSRFTLIKTVSTDGNKYEFNEKYSYSEEEESSLSSAEVENLYISKTMDYRGSKIATNKLSFSQIKDAPNKSKVKFISILYGHKNMSNILTLKVDPDYVREGNNIFSKAFVLRLLKYQYSDDAYIFDEDYELKVMDSKIHTVVIRYNTFMVINDKSQAGYTIVSNE